MKPYYYQCHRTHTRTLYVTCDYINSLFFFNMKLTCELLSKIAWHYLKFPRFSSLLELLLLLKIMCPCPWWTYNVVIESLWLDNNAALLSSLASSNNCNWKFILLFKMKQSIVFSFTSTKIEFWFGFID